MNDEAAVHNDVNDDDDEEDQQIHQDASTSLSNCMQGVYNEISVDSNYGTDTNSNSNFSNYSVNVNHKSNIGNNSIAPNLTNTFSSTSAVNFNSTATANSISVYASLNPTYVAALTATQSGLTTQFIIMNKLIFEHLFKHFDLFN